MDHCVHIRIRRIPHLIRNLLSICLPAGYQTCKPIHFSQDSFNVNFLNTQELARLNEFKALKKQVEWLCGRFSAKALAKEILMPGHTENKICIDYMEQGAPYLTEYPNHCLSLSHSGIYTAAAICTRPQILMGIDIEALKQRPEGAFMKMAFTPGEISDIGSSTRALFRSWTLKEAYLKYIRMGFNENLHKVEILKGKIFHHGKEQDLECQTWELDQGYLLSGVFPPETKINLSHDSI